MRDIRATRSSLQADEYEAFIAAINGTAPSQDFDTRPAKIRADRGDAGDELASLISDIVMVDRLRDVRAVLGFAATHQMRSWSQRCRSRLMNGSGSPPLKDTGRGVFLRFSGDRVREWAKQPAVRERGETLAGHQSHSMLGARIHYRLARVCTSAHICPPAHA